MLRERYDRRVHRAINRSLLHLSAITKILQLRFIILPYIVAIRQRINRLRGTTQVLKRFSLFLFVRDKYTCTYVLL